MASAQLRKLVMKDSKNVMTDLEFELVGGIFDTYKCSFMSTKGKRWYLSYKPIVSLRGPNIMGTKSSNFALKIDKNRKKALDFPRKQQMIMQH